MKNNVFSKDFKNELTRKLIFENGKVFVGKGFGANCQDLSIFEIVFNTSMVGYQEVLSDASYFGQIVCMTYPIIGNYGIKDDDYESDKMHAGAIIVNQVCENPSCDNKNNTKTIDQKLKEFGIPGITNVDTRKITRMIRDEGSMRVLITDSNITVSSAVDIIKKTPMLKNHVKMVSCSKIWEYKKSLEYKFKIILIDCGVKFGILKELSKRNCQVIIVPYNTNFEKIISLEPDGVIISNGPGDPKDNIEVINTIKNLFGKIPIFGICLGHQMISLAAGASTFKMKFGHRGANHPVKELSSNKVIMTAQNHSFSIDEKTLKNTSFKITHVNILDNSIEGIEDETNFVFSVQFHPEGSPGPNDSTYLFDKFLENIKKFNDKIN